MSAKGVVVWQPQRVLRFEVTGYEGELWNFKVLGRKNHETGISLRASRETLSPALIELVKRRAKEIAC